MIKKFRKKPIIIEAVKWIRTNTDEVEEFVGKKLQILTSPIRLLIPTLESPHEANQGDWIIKGIKGEFYPCKPDIFEQTYEKVSERLKSQLKKERK